MKRTNEKKPASGQASTRPSSQAPRPHRGAIGVFAMVLLALLLVIPVYAVSRLANWIDWRVLAVVPLALSTFTFLAYRSDKRRAEAGAWRIPESTLHLSELIGGWPGAFLAQQLFRHKTAKTSYQIVFWAIVLVHEYIALDSLLGWRFTTDFLRFLKSQMA